MKNIVALSLCLVLLWGGLEASAQAQAPQDRSSARPHRPDSAGRAAAIIGRADTDGDGKVSFEEMHTLRPQTTPEQFRRFDTDGDGFLTPADRLPDQEPRRNQEEIRRQMLTKLLLSDRDGDGAVTYEELIREKPGFPMANFQRLDMNRDGVLSQEDLIRSQRIEGRPHAVGEGNRERKPAPDSRRALMEQLRTADSNQNGQITLDEAQRAIPGFSEERFHRMDTDGDGVLTPSDRLQRPKVP